MKLETENILHKLQFCHLPPSLLHYVLFELNELGHFLFDKASQMNVILYMTPN